jgi:hypothetical protein
VEEDEPENLDVKSDSNIKMIFDKLGKRKYFYYSTRDWIQYKVEYIFSRCRKINKNI